MERKATSDQRRALGLAVPGRRPRYLEDKKDQSMAVEPPESQAPDPPAAPPPPDPPSAQFDPMDLSEKRTRKIENRIRKELEEATAEPVPDPEDPDLADHEMEPPQTPKEEGKRKFKLGGALDDLPFAIRKKFNGPEPSPPKRVKYQEQPQGL